MKFLSLLFILSLLVACGGHEKAGSGESKKTVTANNWPEDLSATEDELFTYDPDISSNIGLLVITAENLPDWLQVDPKTGVVTGTPSNDDAGSKVSGVKLIGINNGNSVIEVGPFSIDVIAVNDAPELAAQTVIVTKSNAGYQGQLAYTDVDNTVSQLVFNVVEQPSAAQVSLAPGNNTITVTPTSLAAFTEPQTFTVTVKDSELTSSVATVTLQLTDEGAFQFTTDLPANASIVSPAALNITASQPVTSDKLTGNTQSGACTGTVQVSLDNFATCLAISLQVKNALGTEFSVAADFQPAKTYSYRISETVQSVFAKTAAQAFEQSFQTVDELLITEVSGSEYTHRHRWIELYNASAEAIDLSGYGIKTEAVDGLPNSYPLEARIYNLPAVVVNPGQYIQILSQNFERMLQGSEYQIYLGDNVENPFWWNTGFIELVSLADNRTVDYIGFGTAQDREDYEPQTPSAWVNDLLPPHAFPAQTAEMHSYVRNGFLQDSNTADDWSITDVVTPGYANDATCLLDEDADGLFDCGEVEGSTFAGVDIYALGARQNQKDIFIEVDYMLSDTEPDTKTIPRKRALEKVKEAFAEQGIVVHFDTGSLFDGGEFNLGGGNRVTEFESCISFDTQENCANFYEIKHQNTDLRRKYSFHYMLFAYQEPDSNVKGRAEINGNDIMITMGGWKNLDDSELTENQIINYQAGIIMHELGHNLGLRHGGHHDLNLKPNYVSSMNYLYDAEGLPTIGNQEGDRYYDYWFVAPNSCAGAGEGVTNPATGDPDDFVIGYSHGLAVSIVESAISESAGLGHIGSVPVDFDCDGTISEQAYQMNITDFSSVVRYESLEDHDDWSAINLVFQSQYSSLDSRDGQQGASPNPQAMPVLFMGDDKAEISQEQPRH